MKIRLLIVPFLLLLATHGFAQPVPDDTQGRLWRLCKVWGYTKYYSPNTCQVKWDSLLNATIPLVQSSASNADFNNRIMDLLSYIGQVPPALATPVPAADSNLNLQLEWTDDPVFSVAVRSFLDTFEHRAGANDSISCRLKLNDYTNPNIRGLIDARNDKIRDVSVNYTDAGSRLLVLFHYWNFFNYFGPYRNLTDKNWDSTLLHTIPEVIAANTGKAFQFAFIKLQSAIDDSHGFFYCPDYEDSLGSSFPGIEIERIEQQPVVTKVYPGVTGIAIGDRLVSIDGIPVGDLVSVLRDYIAASNEPVFYRDAYTALLRSRSGSKNYTFLNAAGETYSQMLACNLSLNDWSTWVAEDTKPIWSTLCNGYGYVNIGKLDNPDMDQMYADLKDKEAIVFDVRNYPKSTMFDLASRLMHWPPLAARYFKPDLRAAGRYTILDDEKDYWENPAPYTGRCYFLVNEETQSAAEYFVQYLSHVAGSKVVGSQTAGADGNINSFSYPGIVLYFSGLGWYYDDWYQCQRNGIKIDNTVTPTIQGIREGRDEVLQSVSGCTSSIADAMRGAIAVKLYPNPVAGTLLVSMSTLRKDKATIRISDVMGRTLYVLEGRSTGPARQPEEIDLSRLDAGIYFVRISSLKHGEASLKLLKN